MRYIYKTVSLEEYLRANKDLTIGALSGALTGQIALALQASKAIESLINHYAKDGWEYLRSEEFHTDFFRSGSARIFNAFTSGLTKKSAANPLLQMFVFRQEYSEEVLRSFEEESRKELEEAVQNSTTENTVIRNQPENADSTCPNCDSLVNKADDSCWNCQASFGDMSSWRPSPLKD
jgi:hypothetical protein